MTINSPEMHIDYSDPILEPIPSKGKNNTLYTFSVGNDRYLLRELNPDSLDYQGMPGTPEEVLNWTEQAYRIAKKYYKDKLIDTIFLLANNSKGDPTVVSIRPFVEGKNLDQVVYEGDGETCLECARVSEDFEKTWREVVKDPEWDNIPQTPREYFQIHDLQYSNIIKKPSGEYILIDF